MLGALSEARAGKRLEERGARDEPACVDAGEPRGRSRRTVLIAGGTEVVPQLARRAARGRHARRHLRRSSRAGSRARGSAPARRSPSSRRATTCPEALREACRLAASPQLRAMGTIGGNLLQSTRCWYWRLDYPCRLHGGDDCHARDGEHREHAIFANDFCASAHPSDVAAALLALGATLRTNRRELPLAELYRLPDEDDRRADDARARRGAARARGAGRRRVRLPEGDGPQALRVPARRRRRRRGAAGRRRSRWPASRRCRGCSTGALDEATPLPGHRVQGRGRAGARRHARSLPSTPNEALRFGRARGALVLLVLARCGCGGKKADGDDDHARATAAAASNGCAPIGCAAVARRRRSSRSRPRSSTRARSTTSR